MGKGHLEADAKALRLKPFNGVPENPSYATC